MSFAKFDRKNQYNYGNSIHYNRKERLGSLSFASEIANALRRDFGSCSSAIKTITRLTNVNQRTARNWYEGRNAPNGEFLTILCGHSDEVLITVLNLAGRKELITAKRLVDAKGRLLDVLSALTELEQDALEKHEATRRE